MKQKIYILIGIIIFFFIITSLWWNQANRPVDFSNKTITTFTITRGETARSIAERLQKQGLIRSSVAFFILARFGGISGDLQAGDFRLSPSMDLQTVTATLTHGTFDVRITIPEGWRKEEIALELAKQLNIPQSEFEKVAKEGYMFPDTYLIPKDASAAGVADIFLANFNKKITAEMKERARNKGLTLDEVIKIASLLEREVRFDEDRSFVASVILNRLKIGMKLDIDATVQYALGYQPNQKSWWKKDLTSEDLGIDSPYNTYKNAGLPPTPISNPGLAVIKSVIEAPETDYLYYMSDKSGKIHFAKTIEEQNSNIAQYLNR